MSANLDVDELCGPLLSRLRDAKTGLGSSELQYLQQHGVEDRLVQLFAELAKAKPEDPFKFLSDALLKPAAKPQSASPKAAPAAPKAAPATPKAAEAPKAKAGKEEKAKKPKDSKALAVASKGPTKGGGMGAKKAEDVPLWYEQVIMKSEMIEQYPVKGCFTLRPWAYAIWEVVQRWFDDEIKKTGVVNAYFPMFIPREYIEKEKDHLSDFAPELAWVTRCGDKEMEEPVALRPTSETAMYAAYSGWVQSHRDLPIKINQWCNMVRWEVKQTTPFLRMRENLWQEGHTAFADRQSAETEVRLILELYARIYEDLLALPVVRGKKTKAETFPGADYTTTVEAYIPATGRAIQGATSHHLGQNFSKMFDISFQDPADPTGKKRENAFQNSWGITTRTIGVMIMVHGDDRGLVLPPPVAAVQVVIIPVGLKAGMTEKEKQDVFDACQNCCTRLKDAGVRAKVDDDDRSPGWKFNYWEMKGVPLRIEIGPMDLAKGQYMMAKRHVEPTKDSKIAGKDAKMVEEVTRALVECKDELYEKALGERNEKIASIDTWAEFTPNLNAKKLLLVPFCGDPECEEAIKEKSKAEAAEEEDEGGLKMGAKSLCIPFEDKYNVKCPSKCIRPECNGNSVTRRTLFGRSY